MDQHWTVTSMKEQEKRRQARRPLSSSFTLISQLNIEHEGNNGEHEETKKGKSVNYSTFEEAVN